MALPKLNRLKFLSIGVDNEEDAMYALGSLLAAHINAMIGWDYKGDNYIEPVIVIYDKDFDEAINILRHLSFVKRLFENKGVVISGGQVVPPGQVEYETEYTKSLGEEFPPELAIK